MENRIAIIFGGKSSEHEVSLMSAAAVIRAIEHKYELVYIGITKEGDWKLVKNATPEMIEKNQWIQNSEDFDLGKLKEICDFALPIVHGPYCEDGKLQGVFEMLDIPYGGCGVLASALAMDKLAAKDIFQKVGFPICKHKAIFKFKWEENQEKQIEKIKNGIGFPCFVKPANMGSSVGITKAHNEEELIDAVTLALKYDKRLIIEEALNVRDVETGILGNEHPKAAACGEIVHAAEFYDYDAKYNDENDLKLLIPAPIEKETYDEIRRLAVKAYQAIDGEGFARIDFFVEKQTGKIYINEINTIPGFTKFSMFPLLWQEAGLSFTETIDRIITLGFERYNERHNA